MRLIYIITKFILFPGTYLRGFFEHLTCKLLHLEVESTGYLRADEISGHVEHLLASTTPSAWVMATLPGFFMFNIGVSFMYFGVLNVFYMGITPYDSLPLFIIYCVSMYLGASCINSLFPMTEDVLQLWSLTYSKREHKNALTAILSIIVKVILFPWALITRIGAFLEKNCINFLILVAYFVIHIVTM